ncbi:MAG: aminodeoxychorismate lyase [Gammaproteobacteria bacterium]
MSLINGQPAETVDIRDRGLAYGDGLFETIAVLHGQAEHLERHLARLETGCRRLSISAPDRHVLRDEVQEVAGNETRVIKIILTRGVGGRGYRKPENPSPTRIVTADPWPDYPETFENDGVRVRLCRQRLARNPALAGIKHLNRLEQVLARSEWVDTSIAEGLMLDDTGHVIEATQSNVFFVHAGVLVTPALDQAGVAGVVREVVLEHAERDGISCEVRDVDQAEIREFEEMFLTNSVIGIWPVKEYEGHPFKQMDMAKIIADHIVQRPITA